MLSSHERRLLSVLLGRPTDVDETQLDYLEGWRHKFLRSYFLQIRVPRAAFKDVCRQLLARVREDRYLQGEGAWRDLDLMERLVLLAAGYVAPVHSSLVQQIERITGVDPRNFFPWPEE